MMVATLFPRHDTHKQAAHNKVACKDQRHMPAVDDQQTIEDAGQMGKGKVAPGHA